MAALRVGAQCEGYAGMFMALQQLCDVEHAWYAEYDPGGPGKGRPPLPIEEQPASRVLAHHFPGVPNHGDITTFDWSSAERVEIVTSTFPCTDISPAGKQKGSAGKNFLWSTGVLPALKALRPPLAIFENVPNLLRIENGQVFARILADLDDLGYAVSWTVAGACKVGACHHRHRVFIAATLVEVRTPMSDSIAHRTGDSWGPAQFVLFGDTEAVRWPAAGFTRDGSAWEMTAEPCGIDGATLPSPMAADGDRQSACFARGNPTLCDVVHDGQIHSLFPTPRASDGEKGGPNQRGSSGDVMLPSAVQPERFGKYASAVLRHERAYGLVAPDPTEPGRSGKPRLAPAFPEWMQGLHPGWLTDVVDRKAALKLAGNGVNPRQAAYALPTLPTFTAAVKALTSQSGVFA